MAFDMGRLGVSDFSYFGNPTIYSQPNDNFMTSGVGASNPTAAYMQTASVSPSTGSGIGSIGNAQPGAGLGGLGTGTGSGTGLGFNIGTGQLLLGGLQTIGSLWSAWEANKLAKKQLSFQKDFANANLANSIKSYNTALEDRSRSRAFTEGQDDATAQAYIDKNRLQERTIS